MNRPIKFRAWVEYGHMMVEFGLNDVPADFITNPSNFKVMQFTGLLDKNGKEIYEGDIVKETGTPPDVSVGWEPKVIVAEIPRVYFERWMNVTGEVIGNIYENPELLGKTE